MNRKGDQEDLYGARLLEIGYSQIRLLVRRPPHDADTARKIAAEHYAFCDESGEGLTTIADALIGQPIWAFWWD